MARAKHQGKGKGGSARAAEPSPRKQRGPNHRGASNAEEAELREQLHELGLRVKEVAADGNCFFRAMCDQRWGDEDEHLHLRRLTIEYMKANRDDFEPFIEDDEKWDAYVERMGEDGTWAGNMELQAASLVCMTNVCVHQAGQPRWEIVNFPTADRWFHVAYEGGDHYNSVELISRRWYLDNENGGEREASGPISLLKGRDGRAAPGWRCTREPTQSVVNECVARSGGGEEAARSRGAPTLRRRRRRGGGGAASGDVLPRGAQGGRRGPEAQRIRPGRSPDALRGRLGQGRERGDPRRRRRRRREDGRGRFRRRLGARGDQETRRRGQERGRCKTRRRPRRARRRAENMMHLLYVR